MRVIAGSARRLRLITLEGLETRPTGDKIKETLFNILQFGLPDTEFLDLFSGSGAIAIEALSRGAARAVLVENNRRAAECIRTNLETTHFTDKAELMLCDVMTAIRRLEDQHRVFDFIYMDPPLEDQHRVFDFIYMDPPFRKDLERAVLERLAGSPILTPDTLIIVEAARETEFDYIADLGYRLIKEKVYKTSRHEFLAFGSGGQE